MAASHAVAFAAVAAVERVITHLISLTRLSESTTIRLSFECMVNNNNNDDTTIESERGGEG